MNLVLFSNSGTRSMRTLLIYLPLSAASTYLSSKPPEMTYASIFRERSKKTSERTSAST